MSQSKSTDYALLVNMYVAEANIEEFERRMKRFLMPDGKFEAFSRLDPTFNYKLLLGLKGSALQPLSDLIEAKPFGKGLAEARDFLTTNPVNKNRRAGSTAKIAHYVHLWSIPDLEDLNLGTRMRACAEDPLYMELDEAVLSEDQEFIRRVQLGNAPRIPDTKKTVVIATRQFDFSNLGPYLLQLRGFLPQLEGWKQLFQFQTVTGQLNRVNEFWETDQTGDLPATTRGGSDKAWQQWLELMDGLQAAQELRSYELAPYLTQAIITQQNQAAAAS